MQQEVATKRSFRRYESLRRIDDRKTSDLLYGQVYVFPKIDGTNASVWHSGVEICCGSRNRQLSLDNDNAGFMHWVYSDEDHAVGIRSFLEENSHLVLYGEWLVPHTLKTYREDAWRNFYVFDVYNTTENRYVPYNVYREWLDDKVAMVHPLCLINSPSQEQIYNQVNLNTYLIKDGEGAGEGVVVKNYDWVNYEGNQTWAKVVRDEFKEKSGKGDPTVKEGPNQVIKQICDDFCTATLVEKSYYKVLTVVGNEQGIDSEDPEFEGKVLEKWRGQVIPRTLNMVWEDLIEEEILAILKKYKNPTIDFKALRGRITFQVKKVLPTLF